jgi:hypothetical protein
MSSSSSRKQDGADAGAALPTPSLSMGQRVRCAHCDLVTSSVMTLAIHWQTCSAALAYEQGRRGMAGAKKEEETEEDGGHEQKQAPPKRKRNDAPALVNKWYLYETSGRGYRAILDFPSVEALCDHVQDEDFLEIRIVGECDEHGRAAHQDAVQRFRAHEMNAEDFGESLLQNLTTYDCPVQDIVVENFAQLCTGWSTLSREAIGEFCRQQKMVPPLSAIVTDAHMAAFQEFLDTAQEHWMG